MKTLIIGSGSAAKRHTHVLEQMGHDFVSVPSEADYVVIASLTPKHIDGLKILEDAGFKGKCLVEKPLFMSASKAFEPSFPIYVGYQLRFYPVIQALRKAIEGASVYSAHIYAGQHISLWGGTYHGDKSKGGGVLRDYSHEFDLISYLIGHINDWRAFRIFRGIIKTESGTALVGIANECLISLQLNYFDSVPRREWIVTTDKGTFKADLAKSTLNGEAITGNDPTKLMHEAILTDGKDVCTYEEGLAINRLIDRIETCA